MYALELYDLYKKYANGFEALKGINLNVTKGDFFALLGANGAGKSTTIGVIATLLTKTSGVVKINGHDLDHEPQLAKSYLGLVPQEINLNMFETCTDILVNQAGYYGILRTDALLRAGELLEQLGLSGKARAIVRQLSGGMKRRLMIARALMSEPRLLLLDEPTAGVDIETRHGLWKFLQEINARGTTIILTTHYLEEAEHLCRNIAIIDGGHLVENTSITNLLRTINFQTFIFNTSMPVKGLSALQQVSNLKINQLDLCSFEIRVDNTVTLNDIFALLNEHQIIISSMRNKSNRLEELFLNRIKYEL